MDEHGAQQLGLPQKPWVLMGFYTFEDLRKPPYPQRLLNLIEKTETLHNETKFRRYAGSLYRGVATDEYENRFRTFALSRHRLQMEQELTKGLLRDLTLFDWNNLEKSSISYKIRCLGKPEENPYDPTWIKPNWIIVEFAACFSDEPRFFPRFLELGKDIFTSIKAAYGYIDFDHTPRDLWLIHMGQLYTHYKELWDEIEAWTLQQRYCRERVKKAFWGNFLNVEHVRQLGGFSKIKEAVPYKIVESLPEGGALLIASGHPAEKDRPDVARRIAQLQAFLKPILMKIEPIPPRHPKHHPPA